MNEKADVVEGQVIKESTPAESPFQSGPTMKDAMDELKHSIKMHALIRQGPSTELASFLVKLVDIVEDEDPERKLKDIMHLSFHISAGIAMFIQKALDDRDAEARKKGEDFPQAVRDRASDILTSLGQARRYTDMAEAKEFILKASAEALRELGKFTRATYPQLTTTKGENL